MPIEFIILSSNPYHETEGLRRGGRPLAEGGLRDVPWLGLGEGDDHPLVLLAEHDLAAEAGVLVELPVPGGAGEDVALLVGGRGQLLEPLLRDVDLALGGAGVDVVEAVGGRLDELRVGERAEEGLPGQADHLAARAVQVDGEDAHDAVRDLGGGGGGGGCGSGGGR